MKDYYDNEDFFEFDTDFDIVFRDNSIKDVFNTNDVMILSTSNGGIVSFVEGDGGNFFHPDGIDYE